MAQTWSRPYYAHRSSVCTYSDDKNWIVVDNSPSSPHFGRVYQFWTPFRYTSTGRYISAPQAVRWSDDSARTWSKTSYVTPLGHGSQNSQPMIMSDGTIVDTFYDFGPGGAVPDVAPGGAPEQGRDAQPATIFAGGSIFAATSHNGGRTWSRGTEVVNNARRIFAGRAVLLVRCRHRPGHPADVRRVPRRRR